MKTAKTIKIIVFIAVAALMLWGGVKYNERLDRKAAEEEAAIAQRAQEAQQKVMEAFKKDDTQVGWGAEVQKGDTITVQYIGTFDDGKKFDSSYDHGTPFTFTIGEGQVIQGWDLGLIGMKEGGVRKLTIPPELGYGSQGAGGGLIPANATLHFTVTLEKVEHPK